MNNKGNQHQGNNDNSWGGQNVRKSYDNYYNNRGDYQHQHDGGNKIEQRMQNIRLDNSSSGGNKTTAEHKEQGGAKKMTWATIASQPAKPQISTTSTTVKKKGFGPPPPMIPGKHSMELTDGWDTPKNGPLVPPSPPVIQAPQPELIEKQNSSNFEGQPAWPTPGQAQNQIQTQTQNQNQSQSNLGGNYPTQQQQQREPQPSSHHQQQHQNNNQRGGYHSMNNNNNNGNGQNNNYQDRHSDRDRQYNQNSSGSRQNYNNSSHHYNNDFQKPYHQHQMAPPPQNHQASAPITRSAPPPAAPPTFTAPVEQSEDSILEQLRVKNQYNPSDLDLSQVDNARFFVIKSYSEDDIHRSIKYEIWCSTEHGNKRLDQAFREREKENGIIYLFFSVNSSGHFCGVAQMITQVDYNSNSSVWSQDKWKGSFRVKWIYVKDVPNTQLRHIRLENNENKPVTNSRDTQEVPNGHGIQMMKIIHSFKHTTSIFDDFTHYEKRQEEEDGHKHESHDAYQKPMTLPPSHHSTHNRENMNRQQQYDNGGGRSFDRDRDYNNGSSGGFERGNYNNGNNGGGYNKYGNSGYNNDYKPSFNGRGGFQKRNDFRNDRDGDQNSGGFFRAKPEYQHNDDFGGNRGGYRSDRGNGSRGRGGNYRSPNNDD